jgi:hypothetical protein
MARIELRDATIKLKDGFGGAALVNDSSIAGGNTTLGIDTITGLTNNLTVVPVGARFSITGVATPAKFTVTAQNSNEIQRVVVDATSGNFTISTTGTAASPVSVQTTASIAYHASASAVQSALEALAIYVPGDVLVTSSVAGTYDIEFAGNFANTNMAQITATDVDLAGGGDSVTPSTVSPGGSTHDLTFTPALDAGDLPSNNDVITFLPQEIEIKVGDGDLKYTEKNNYTYDLDRGDLDTVREGDQVPMDLVLDFVYEHITTGTSEEISPMDALKQKGGASGWVSSSTDQCEPYSVDVEITHEAPCGTNEDEVTLFPDFRSDQREISLKDATISITGRCNATEPTVTRV